MVETPALIMKVLASALAGYFAFITGVGLLEKAVGMTEEIQSVCVAVLGWTIIMLAIWYF